MNIYAVKDEIIGFNGAIMTARNDEEVTRWFSAVINDKEENNMSKWYKDYSVWGIGKLDRVTGEVMTEAPRLICRGDSVKTHKREPNTIEEMK